MLVVALFVVAMYLVPVFYVLSSGPAIYLFKTGVVSEGTLLTIYWPLRSLSQTSPTFGSFMDGYAQLWSP